MVVVVFFIFDCLRLQRYKFLKQFTTHERYNELQNRLFETTKIQIFKAIHNSSAFLHVATILFETTKIQIFKAIHNRKSAIIKRYRTVWDYKDTNF